MRLFPVSSLPYSSFLLLFAFLISWWAELQLAQNCFRDWGGEETVRMERQRERGRGKQERRVERMWLEEKVINEGAIITGACLRQHTHTHHLPFHCNNYLKCWPCNFTNDRLFFSLNQSMGHFKNSPHRALVKIRVHFNQENITL